MKCALAQIDSYGSGFFLLGKKYKPTEMLNERKRGLGGWLRKKRWSNSSEFGTGFSIGNQSWLKEIMRQDEFIFSFAGK